MGYFEDKYILAMDTAGDHGSIAVSKGKDCLLELSWRSDAPHSRTLLPVIDKALGILGLDLKDMGLIAVNRGPGRWTGIRLGISTAMGLSMALGIPVKGVAGLDAMAYRATGSACLSGDVILPVLDARRSQVYTAVYVVEGFDKSMAGRIPVRQSDYAVAAPESFMASFAEILTKLTSNTGEGVKKRIVLLGDGSDRILAPLQALKPTMDILVRSSPASFMPGAAAVGYAALQDFESGGRMQWDCTPLYIRPSDAEANKK